MTEAQAKSLVLQTVIGLVAFTPLGLGPKDAKVPGLCRALADSLEIMVRQGEKATWDFLTTQDEDTLRFIVSATPILMESGLKPLDAVEEMREMAAQLEAEQAAAQATTEKEVAA